MLLPLLPNCTMFDHFPDFSLAIFACEISEQASWQMATEEPTKSYKHGRRRNLRCNDVNRDGNPQRENVIGQSEF